MMSQLMISVIEKIINAKIDPITANLILTLAAFAFGFSCVYFHFRLINKEKKK
jgi:hypothetical protein